MAAPPTILYKRATFVTQLPVHHRYAPSHCWIAPDPDAPTPNRWRVGYTKFALRMLGEVVDSQFDHPAGTPIQPGDILGSIEGFKAVSDLYSVGHGTFAGGNPALLNDPESIARAPYSDGWIYAFDGQPDSQTLDVHQYQHLLDTTIDRILAQQKTDEPA